MRKIIILLLPALLLSGCGGEEEISKREAGKIAIEYLAKNQHLEAKNLAVLETGEIVYKYEDAWSIRIAEKDTMIQVSGCIIKMDGTVVECN